LTTIRNLKQLNTPIMLASTCWIAALAFTIFALLNQDKFIVATDLPIASIVQIQRDVSYGNETDLAWTIASESQSFFEGDRLSTGTASTATLRFGNEIFVVVGPESIVSVSTISQRDALTFVVNIIKGAVKPIVSKASKNSLIVSSGEKSFNIEPGKSIGIAKLAKGSIREFGYRQRFPDMSRKTPSEPSKSVAVNANFKEAALQLVPIRIDTASLSVKKNPFKPLDTNETETKLDMLTMDKKYIDPTLDKAVLDSWKKVDLKLNSDASFGNRLSIVDEPTNQALSSKPLLSPEQVVESEVPIEEPSIMPKREGVKNPDLKALDAKLTVDTKNLDKNVNLQKPMVEANAMPKRLFADSEIVPKGVFSNLAKNNFTTMKFREAGPINFSVELQKPLTAPVGWVGGVEYKIGKSSWVRLPYMESKQKVTIDSSIIGSWSFDKSRQANCVFLLTRFYGAENMQEKFKFSTEQTQAAFCSYAEFDGLLPARLSLQNLAKPSNESGFYEPKYGVSVAARYGVKVTKPEDFLALLPLIRGDRSGAIEFKVNLNQKGVFGVAATGIVAEYLDEFREPALSDRIRGLLDHSVVFEGKQSAIYSSKGMSSTDLKAWIEKNSDSGGKVYLRSKATLVPISKDFLNQSQEVVRFVQGNSPILYLEKVSILSFK
jgi:hypothetical protein